MEKLKSKSSPKIRILVFHSPSSPVGNIFLIGELCVKHNTIIITDDVYNSLKYAPSKRMAMLSPKIWNLILIMGFAGRAFYTTGWSMTLHRSGVSSQVYRRGTHKNLPLEPEPITGSPPIGLPVGRGDEILGEVAR